MKAAPFDLWKETFLRLLSDLKEIFEEELQSLFLPRPTVFEEIQERKNTLLNAYKICVFEGKNFEALLKEIPESQKKGWIQTIDDVQFLAERNATLTQRFIQDIHHSFATFHQWLQRPASQGLYGLGAELSLGLDRRI